ncbi:MAG: hypothetical protein IIB08_05425 [Bacteroidetes bacterium]|nr:hypothetical protein [Bacteroidota bacterium]
MSSQRGVPEITESVSVEAAVSASGIHFPKDEIDEITPGVNDKSILITIYGYGEDFKFQIFEKRTASVVSNGDVSVRTTRSYKGRLVNVERRTFILGGNDLSRLTIHETGSNGGEFFTSYGKVNFDFANKVVEMLNKEKGFKKKNPLKEISLSKKSFENPAIRQAVV